MTAIANQSPFLSDAEIAQMCEPLIMSSAQIRYLRGLGLMVAEKPSGRPLLARSEVERVLGAARGLGCGLLIRRS